jgi:predicted ribosomally synthesized six-cysteine peptide SCIFF
VKHIRTIRGARLTDSVKKGGCGECQTSCQSACKTSCTIANQLCENKIKLLTAIFNGNPLF